MFGLRKHGPDSVYGALVDVGSGSVGVAIVCSRPQDNVCEIVWSERERVSVGESDDGIHTAKRITSALLNGSLALGNTGIKALKAYDKNASIDSLQVTISAPWSYTVTKTISYDDDKEFEVTKKLLDELVSAAHEMAIKAIDETRMIEQIGLEVISRSTVSITANGYQTRNPFGKEVKKLAITHSTGMTHKNLVRSVNESRDKIFSSIETKIYTFMLTYYCVVRDLLPDTAEICLLDVTNEATEIGVVRSNVLKYVTHTPIGINWLVRKLSTESGIAKEDALAIIRSDDSIDIESMSKKKQQSLQKVYEEFEEEIATLFRRTGDNLSIPRTVFLHTDIKTEPFFVKRIQHATRKATQAEHTVHLLTSKLFNEHENDKLNDTAILLSAHFFHNNSHCGENDLL